MPPQYPKEFDSTDLRRLVGVAPKGYKVNPIKSQKRKRVEEPDEEPMEEETAMQQDEPQADVAQAGKRQKADDKTWRPVSSRCAGYAHAVGSCGVRHSYALPCRYPSTPVAPCTCRFPGKYGRRRGNALARL